MNTAVESIPLSGLRGKVGQRMLHSVSRKPHVTLHAEVDAAELLDCRRRLGGHVVAATGRKLTLTVLLVKLAAAALRRYPRINGRVDEERVRLYPMINVGVAVALDEGLLVPVVRDADRKSLAEIAAELALRVGEARSGKLKPPHLLDGTFTISNLGPWGIRHFTPIINPPEIAVLGVGCVTPAPRRRGEEWIEAPMLGLDLSFDHAAIDGAQAARFVQILAEILHDPEAVLASEANGSLPASE